jgi:hypothetical protein
MGVQSDISAALDVAISAVAAVPTTAVLISFPNKAFTPGTVRWYQVWKMPSSTQRVSIGANGLNQYEGLYQISVFDPINKTARVTENEADRICEAFKVGTELTYGTTKLIITAVEQAPAISEATWFHIPISVYYRAVSLS